MENMSETPLASFSLTHVHYDPRDPISLACAWLALFPQGLCIVYATLIYTTREIEIILTFGGQLVCEALNFALKRWIKEERPQAIKALGKGYGMPSSHAQFAAFFATYVGLFLCFRHTPSFAALSVRRPLGGKIGPAPALKSSGNGQLVQGAANGGSSLSDAEDEHSATPAPSISPVYALQLHYPRLTHALLTLGVIALALLVAVSRIYLSYHTPKQVYVGLGAGAAFAILWFLATESVRRMGLVEWVLEWDLVRKARIRDLLCEEDLVELGWQVWEDKRRRRRIGKGKGKGKRVRLVEPPKDASSKKRS